jgi:hypothetical protein
LAFVRGFQDTGLATGAFGLEIGVEFDFGHVHILRLDPVPLIF